MWIVVLVLVVVILAIGAALAIRWRRSTKAVALPVSATEAELVPVHALDDALRSVESLTDATGSSLLDQVDREGRTIRDRLASREAHLHSLRQPDDTGPLLRRVLDEVAGDHPATGAAPLPPPDA